MTAGEPIPQFTARAGGGLDVALDAALLRRTAQGDAGRERDVLESFRRQARTLMLRFETATDPETRSEVARKVKTIAVAIGATRISVAADALDRAARAGDPTGYALAELAEAFAEASSVIELRYADR
jgi:hypothetical protein